MKHIIIKHNFVFQSTFKLYYMKIVFTPNLGKRMLLGGIIGLVPISFFVISAGKGNPAWGEYWRIKPSLLSPILGALVGLCYDVTQPLRDMKGWAGRVFLVLSFVGYGVGIFISLVLGMNGTMWD